MYIYLYLYIEKESERPTKAKVSGVNKSRNEALRNTWSYMTKATIFSTLLITSFMFILIFAAALDIVVPHLHYIQMILLDLSAIFP